MSSEDPVITRMQALIEAWEARADHKAMFLRCYQMMTHNMRASIQQGEFADGEWVDRLVGRFADYYFIALDAYEQDPASAPEVWQLAHNAANSREVSILQELLLGINAHINYDLALALVDLLDPEWDSLSESQRLSRHEDHSLVNTVIARTIDAVQDQVLEPSQPIMDIIDKLLGPIDEYMLSRLIMSWRESVWENTVHLLETRQPGEREAVIQQIRLEAIRKGNLIA